jgi:lipopolysaccharide/colanic/teichoic acid biosynthesis glycosyltransferase
MSATHTIHTPQSQPHRAAQPLLARLGRWWKTQSVEAIKRAIDVMAVAPALLLLAPFFGLMALAIKLEDGGPVLYWQKRVGRNGRVFAFPKFRSMRTDSDAVRQQIEHMNQHGDSLTFKMKNDPRITRVGKLLRRTSMDELPQLLCVLKGDMTLVGPRPPMVSEVAQYTLADRRRLSVTPGLTCIWQVSGRSDIPFPKQAAMDVDYIRERSIALDIRLLLATVPAVLLGRGAY